MHTAKRARDVVQKSHLGLTLMFRSLTVANADESVPENRQHINVDVQNLIWPPASRGGTPRRHGRRARRVSLAMD
jgi:hypothetical protein